MKLLAALCSLMLFAVVSVATAADKAAEHGGDKVAHADASAMKKLAGANMAEIEAGKLAATKAQNADVKKFGQHMVDDHTKMLEDLRKLADAKGVKLPDSPPAKEKGQMKKLESLSPERFDQAYMDHMVKDHQKDVKETDKIISKAKDADFKQAVQDANAKIKEHLQMAQQVDQSVKGSASRGASSSQSSAGRSANAK
jgi:putative membrane protein